MRNSELDADREQLETDATARGDVQLVRISAFIRTDPRPLWQFVIRWGCDPDHDLRIAVACCLLEHLLESHFEFCFSDMSTLAERDRFFATTVQSCWPTLPADENLKVRVLAEYLKSLWGQRLDDLVPDDEPHGTFHDAFLWNIRSDRAVGTWACEVELCTGDPDAADVAERDRRRTGLLTLNGIRVVEAAPRPDRRPHSPDRC